MRSNNRITKLLIHTDIQLLTLYLIGICFHLNISLLNIDNKEKWTDVFDFFIDRLLRMREVFLKYAQMS